MVNYHGAHCRLRSFPTKCPRCKSPVLYWECSHGVKIFFEYPIYGRAIKHRCVKVVVKRSPIKISRNEQLQQTLDAKKFACPACGKIFENEKALLNHIQQLLKTDDIHLKHFGFSLDLINFDSEKENIDEIFSQTSSLNLKQNSFKFKDIVKKVDEFTVKQHFEPNSQEFFVIKKQKSKKTKL